jgi:integrase
MSPLLTLSPRNKHHAMSALANLAKFQGKYHLWKDLINRYNLKWSNKGDSIKSFERFFNPDLTLNAMLQTIKKMVSLLPPNMGKIVQWGVLVGLRPSEIVESVRLINDKDAFTKYYDPVQMTLSHYKFRQFLRTTKKAYISFVSPETLEIVKNLDNIPSYNDIRLACWKIGIKMDMRYCRKIHSSWLHQCGIASETIDFLHGRVSTSVFSRHYLTPQKDLKDRVLQSVEQLKKEIERA